MVHMDYLTAFECLESSDRIPPHILTIFSQSDPYSFVFPFDDSKSKEERLIFGSVVVVDVINAGFRI